MNHPLPNFKSLLGIGLAPLILAATFLGLRPANAQNSENSVIILDDSSPGANVIVTLDNNAPGAVNIEMANAQVVLTDAINTNVLTINDKRVKAFSFQLRQGAPTHILHFTRIAGAKTAQIYLQALATLPAIAEVLPNINTVNDSLPSSNLSTVHLAPATSIPVTINDLTNMLNIQLADQPAMVQMVDANGTMILTKTAADNTLSALTITLSPGPYVLNVANSDTAAQSDLHVALSTAPTSQLMLLVPTETPIPAPCTAQVTSPSANIRSGPGTGYSILSVGYKNDIETVGGVNTQGDWLLVQTKTATGWISTQVTTTVGECSHLTAFNIPTMNAALATPVVPLPSVGIAPPSIGGGSYSAPSNGGGEHDRNEGD